MKCLDNIIGFTQTECNCFTAEELGGEEYKKSNSGLYMDSLEETKHILSAVKAAVDCGSTMGKTFSSARTNAISSFKEKLLIEMGTRFTVRQKPYTGVIGQTSITGPLNLASSWIGSVYEMKPLKSGVFKVSKIYVAINETRQVNIEVYKAYVVGGEYQLQGEPITTIAVDAVQNVATVKVLDAALELPLTDGSSDTVHYLFLMDRSAGFQPMNMQVSCGCGVQEIVRNWLVQGSIEGNDKEHLETINRKTGKGTYANGVLVEADIMCSDSDFICEAYYSSPFIKTAIEHAILYQAASNLLAGVLKTDVINRFTMTKRDEMKMDSVILHNKFKNRVTWISENIDMRANNCFVCNTVNDFHGPYKSGIRF